MSKKMFSKFLSELEQYESIHDLWCASLIKNGRQVIQSVYNNTDKELLTNLMESFMKFVTLLSQCNPNSPSDKKTICSPNEIILKQNKSQDLIPKNDIIKIVNSELQCPICNEWLLKATSSNCNHTFCEMCIKKWLKINKACPVCRSSIEYTSTSLAVDNFISNLCQLFGGLINIRRESLKYAELDHSENQINADLTIDELMNDLTFNQSIEDDTYYNSQLEISGPLTHPNMVRLVPYRQLSPTPISREQSRRITPNSNILHPNTVQLSPYPHSSIRSTTSSHTIYSQSTSVVFTTSSLASCVQSTSIMSTTSSHVSRVQSTSIMSTTSSHVSCVQSTPSTPVMSTTSSSHTSRLQPTTSTSKVSTTNSHTSRIQSTPSTPVISTTSSSHISRLQPTTSTSKVSTTNSYTSRVQSTPSTPVMSTTSSHTSRLQPTPSTFKVSTTSSHASRLQPPSVVSLQANRFQQTSSTSKVSSFKNDLRKAPTKTVANSFTNRIRKTPGSVVPPLLNRLCSSPTTLNSQNYKRLLEPPPPSQLSPHHSLYHTRFTKSPLTYNGSSYYDNRFRTSPSASPNSPHFNRMFNTHSSSVVGGHINRLKTNKYLYSSLTLNANRLL